MCGNVYLHLEMGAHTHAKNCTITATAFTTSKMEKIWVHNKGLAAGRVKR